MVDTDTKEAIEQHLKVVNHQTAALWATDCTKHIIQFFEQKYPQDDRPRKAIEAGRAWVQGEIIGGMAAFAAHAAAREADDNACGYCHSSSSWKSCCLSS
ncbi:putative immunity protein [Peribacillus sp. NPDC060186]